MSEQGTTSQSESRAHTGALVQGNLWRAIWTMSWPLLLSTVSVTIIGLTDMWVAGRISSAAQAAVGLSENLLFLFLVFIMSISVGTTALVSRAAGAGDDEESCKSAAQSISLSFVLGLVLAILSLFCAKFGLQLFNQAQEATDMARLYLTVYSFYLIPFSITSILGASFRAIGDAKTPLMMVTLMTVINIAGDFATVLHGWPVPGLGLRGIAVSGIAGSSIGAIFGLFCLSRSPLKSSLHQLLPLFPSYVHRILKVGIPSGLQRLGWSLSVFVLFFILAKCEHPTNAIAAWTIGMKVEAIMFMPLMALSLAVSSIVGQNLGAQQVERAVSAGWKVTAVGSALMVVLGALVVFFAPFLASRMTSDPVTIEYVTNYLRINALAEPILALTMILGGALQGAGDTKAPMLITVASHWVVRLPLAWTLALSFLLGPTGVWIAMACSCCISAALTTWRFQSRAWIKTRV